MLPRSRALGAGGTPRFCPSTSLAMPERQKRAGTPCNRRRRRAAMAPGWRVRHAHGASSEGRRADIRAVGIVPRHGARRGAPVRRAAQPRGRRAGARPGAAGRRWAPAFASRCQAPGPSPGCRCGCVRSRVGAARCNRGSRPCTHLLCGQSTVSVCGGTAVRGAWPRTHAAATRATELGCAAQGSPRHRRCPVLHCARAWRSPPTHARSRVRDALGGFAARLQIRTKPLQPAAASACARTAPGAEQASRRLIRAAPALMPVLQFTRKAFVCKMSALRLALWTRRARLVLRGEAATAAPNPGSLAPYL